MAAVIVRSPDRSMVGRRFELDGEVWDIGRGSGGNVIVEDKKMSKEHLRLLPLSGSPTYVAEDRNSSNHSFLNGKKLDAPRPISTGDTIAIGNTLLVIDGEPKTDGVPLPAGVKGDEVTEIVGLSFAADYLRRWITLLAKEDSHVMLLGPRGSGKGVTAAAIDRLGRSKLVVTNCGALNANLAGSELFGHVKGAFTNAEGARDGAFKTASKGTLFLDEIGELPLEIQKQLLRVLPEGKIKPVGADHEIKVDVRVIGATNADLEKNGFRSDLLDRMRRKLRVPSLAERRADVLMLWDYFMQRQNPRVAAIPRTREFDEALILYAWPENIRGLETLVEQIAAAAENTNELHIELLPAEMQKPIWSRDQDGKDEETPDPSKSRISSRCPSKAALAALLTEHEGNNTRIADVLGVGRTQVKRWVEHHGLNRLDFVKKKP